MVLLSMKLLIFAHIPPPHHGQSYMVQLMLAGFGGDRRKRSPAARSDSSHSADEGRDYGIECYHVNARLSKRLEDIGDLRIGKFILLLGYCLQAIWCRYRYGVTTMYYIPAPGKPSALYRDWLVMLMCRPVFKKIILHWHAAGLANWLETSVQMRTRSWTYHFLRQVDLSIVLSQYNRADAEKIFSRQIRVVSNGIPDPCPDFERQVLPRRKARFAARRKLLSGQTLTEDDVQHTGGNPNIVRVLYLAHCTREKGLFDTVSGVVLANERLAEQSIPLRLRLLVTGNFVTDEEREIFDRIVTQIRMSKMVDYLGFVSGQKKNELLREADLFCFPTFYPNENQPVNLIEAMAFGLPVLTTRWRSLPEIFPPGYEGLVDVRSPEQISDVLLGLMTADSEALRGLFLRNFTLNNYLTGLATSFHNVEQEDSTRPARAPIPTT